MTIKSSYDSGTIPPRCADDWRRPHDFQPKLLDHVLEFSANCELRLILCVFLCFRGSLAAANCFSPA